MYASHQRGALRTLSHFALGFVGAAVLVHAALRLLAPTFGWSGQPTFGQSLTLLAAVVAVLRLSTWRLPAHSTTTPEEGVR